MVRCPPSPFETRFALLRVRAGFTNHAALLVLARPACSAMRGEIDAF
jgi:hypothetical protein